VKPIAAQSASLGLETKDRNRSCTGRTTRFRDTGIGPQGRALGREGFHHGLLGAETQLHRAYYKNFRRGVENPFDGEALARIPSEWLGFLGSRVVPAGSGGTTA